MTEQYVKVADLEKLIAFVRQMVKTKSRRAIEPKLKRDKWIAFRYFKNETAMLEMRAIQKSFAMKLLTRIERLNLEQS